MSKSKERIKVVIVGDGCSGKTNLLSIFSQGTCPAEYVPTVFETHITDLAYEGKQVELALWDTGGREEYNALRPTLVYGPNATGRNPKSDADVILICYSIVEPATLKAVPEKVNLSKLKGGERVIELHVIGERFCVCMTIAFIAGKGHLARCSRTELCMVNAGSCTSSGGVNITLITIYKPSKRVFSPSFLTSLLPFLNSGLRSCNAFALVCLLYWWAAKQMHGWIHTLIQR